IEPIEAEDPADLVVFDENGSYAGRFDGPGACMDPAVELLAGFGVRALLHPADEALQGFPCRHDFSPPVASPAPAPWRHGLPAAPPRPGDRVAPCSGSAWPCRPAR